LPQSQGSPSFPGKTGDQVVRLHTAIRENPLDTASQMVTIPAGALRLLPGDNQEIQIGKKTSSPYRACCQNNSKPIGDSACSLADLLLSDMERFQKARLHESLPAARDRFPFR